MKGEEIVELQGVAGEEQWGRQQEAREPIEKWLRACPVELSCRTSDAIRLILGLPQ